jgi:hypothetical protein
MPVAVFSACGQPSGGPSGEHDQSKARIRSPISPPSARKERLEGSEPDAADAIDYSTTCPPAPREETSGRGTIAKALGDTKPKAPCLTV